MYKYLYLYMYMYVWPRMKTIDPLLRNRNACRLSTDTYLP